jgi:hypothetical protein
MVVHPLRPINTFEPTFIGHARVVATRFSTGQPCNSAVLG